MEGLALDRTTRGDGGVIVVGTLRSETGKDCGWKHPMAPAVRKLWKEGATEAVLELLRDAQVGCWTPAGRLLRGGVDRVEEGEEGEEGGPGQP